MRDLRDKKPKDIKASTVLGKRGEEPISESLVRLAAKSNSMFKQTWYCWPAVEIAKYLLQNKKTICKDLQPASVFGESSWSCSNGRLCGGRG